MWIIVARAVLSWVNPDPYNPIVRFLYQATEPVLYRIRSSLPFQLTGIDFSPIIVFVIIIFLDNFLVGTIKEIAMRLN
jgi:YggT family protein